MMVSVVHKTREINTQQTQHTAQNSTFHSPYFRPLILNRRQIRLGVEKYCEYRGSKKRKMVVRLNRVKNIIESMVAILSKQKKIAPEQMTILNHFSEFHTIFHNYTHSHRK